MRSQDICLYKGKWGEFDSLRFQLGHMKNIASLKVVQEFKITRIHPTCLVEMRAEKNFRAKECFDKASKSALEAWKVRSRMYLRSHFIHRACLTVRKLKSTAVKGFT